MAPAARKTRRKDEIKVTIAPFRSPADFKSCEEIQREVWHAPDIDIVPASLLLASSRTGGVILGAFNNLGDMVGFVFSMPGSLNGLLIHHSHMLAVRSAYRNFDVGYKLKLAQRKEVLKRKISWITCSLDPMQPLHAYFAFGKLGALGVSYEEDSRGELGLPADRITARWHIESADVAERLDAGPPRRDLRRELKQKPVINTLVEAAPGMMNSSPVKLNCSADKFLFEVPYNLPEIKNRDLGIALEWQGRMRQVFQHYFKKKYAATDFLVAEQDGHLRSFYLLEKKEN